MHKSWSTSACRIYRKWVQLDCFVTMHVRKKETIINASSSILKSKRPEQKIHSIWFWLVVEQRERERETINCAVQINDNSASIQMKTIEMKNTNKPTNIQFYKSMETQTSETKILDSTSTTYGAFFCCCFFFWLNECCVWLFFVVYSQIYTLFCILAKCEFWKQSKIHASCWNLSNVKSKVKIEGKFLVWFLVRTDFLWFLINFDWFWLQWWLVNWWIGDWWLVSVSEWVSEWMTSSVYRISRF